MSMTPPLTMPAETGSRKSLAFDRFSITTNATALQHRGLTFTEIAELLDCRRETIVNLLYWDKVATP